MNEEEARQSPQFRQFIELLADIVVESMEREARERDSEQLETDQESAGSEPPTDVHQNRRTQAKRHASSDVGPRPNAGATKGQWDVRDLDDGVSLELMGGRRPAVVIRQEDQAIRVELVNVKALVAAHLEGAAALAEGLSRGAGGHHAERSCIATTSQEGGPR